MFPTELLIALICVLYIAGAILAIFGFVNRISFISKMQSLCKLSDDRTWKVWRLSAIEPAVTTLIGAMWLRLMMNAPGDNWAYDYGIHIALQMSILLFIGWIWVVGEGCRRGRLAITVLFTRLIILTAPLIAMLFGLHAYSERFTFVAIGSMVVAFIIRALFGIYQNRVTPSRTQFERMQMEEQINMNRREIEDGVTLFDDVDLWDEQVALIERLKAEQFG